MKPAAIRLSGDNILEEHCYFDNSDGKVTIHCLQNSVTVSLRC
jgi:kinesin family protein 1